MDEKKFWQILDMLDWDSAGDDNAVLAPAVEYLSKLSDEDIFAFEDIMSRLLYDLDSKRLAIRLYGDALHFSGDMFLYQRCVALINGEQFYRDIVSFKRPLDEDLEFEALIYLPQNAWAKKHSKEPEEYPYYPKVSYETGSNEELWK